MPPMPSDPASMPTPRKSSAIGTPIRCDARLNSTLTAEQDAADGEQEGGRCRFAGRA